MPSISSAIAHINLSITVNSHGAARQTRRLTPQGWRLRRVSHACYKLKTLELVKRMNLVLG